VFCIASAGCTAFALSQRHEVVACDINPVQVEYVRRRLAGGPREIGSAERILGLMRLGMPLVGWSRRRIANFLELSDPAEQLRVFRDSLETRRLRASLWLLMSPLWLRGWYTSSLLSALPPRFDRALRRRMERCFASHANRTNPYARDLLLGLDAGEDASLASVARGAALELVVDDAASYLERSPHGSFAGFSLSNILDGARPEYRARLLAAVRHAARADATVVVRSFAEPPAKLLTNHAAEDRSMLWGVVDVRRVETL
jgi:hypothetical protein